MVSKVILGDYLPRFVIQIVFLVKMSDGVERVSRGGVEVGLASRIFDCNSSSKNG